MHLAMVILSKWMTINSENINSTYMEKNHAYHEMDVTKGWMNRVKKPW